MHSIPTENIMYLVVIFSAYLEKKMAIIKDNIVINGITFTHHT